VIDHRPQTYVLVLRNVPPSYNRTRHAHWRVEQKAKRELQEEIAWSLMEAQVPKHLRLVTAWAKMTFGTRRARDEDNYRTPLAKALGDALVVGRYLPDDTPEHFTMGRVSFDAEPGPERTRIALTVFAPYV
jgi:hypothetical protein